MSSGGATDMNIYAYAMMMMMMMLLLLQSATTNECCCRLVVGAFSLPPAAVANTRAHTHHHHRRRRRRQTIEHFEAARSETSTKRRTRREHEKAERAGSRMVRDSNGCRASHGDNHHGDDDSSILDRSTTRRTFLALPVTFLPAAAAFSPATAASAAAAAAAAAAGTDSSSPDDLLKQVQRASEQLRPVPQLIKDQKWDAVRAVLIEPPLADCWKKTNRPLLQRYAEAVDDELAALEAKEELVSHLRYLDMAVYNNVFNPIATEGQSGATKELVRSYYEDPINEYEASKKAFDELLQLMD